MSLFGDCAVKRAKYKPTTSALREYGICGFRAPDEDRDATPSSELRESAPLLGGDALPCCDGDGRRRRACSCAGLPCAVWWLCVLPLSAVAVSPPPPFSSSRSRRAPPRCRRGAGRR